MDHYQNGTLLASVDDFMQSDIAQMAVEMGYHHDLIRYVVTQHLRETGRQFSTPDELLESIRKVEGQGIDPTFGELHTVEAMDVDFNSTSAMSSSNVDILPQKFAGLSIHDKPRKKMSPPSTRVPPVTPIGTLRPQICTHFLKSEMAQMAAEMGFPCDLINDVLNQLLQKTGQPLSTISELIHSLLEVQGQSNDPTPSGLQAMGGQDVPSTSAMSSSIKDTSIHQIPVAGQLAGRSIRDELRKKISQPSRRVPPITPIGSLRPQISVSSGSSDPNKLVCKVCLDKEFSIVFLPCTHLATCSDCAMRLPECPICREPVGDSLKVIIS